MTISHDQMYLGSRLSERHESPLSPAAIELLNQTYGQDVVTNAMRELHGFPPRDPVKNVFSYLKWMCRQATEVSGPTGYR